MNDEPNQPPIPPQQPPQPPPAQPPPAQQPPATPPPTGPPAAVGPKPPKSGKAVASMVLGIVALVSLFCGWLLFSGPTLILGILAIVFGKMAKDEIAEQPELEGESQAKAGFIMGIIATAIGSIVLLVMLIGLAAS